MKRLSLLFIGVLALMAGQVASAQVSNLDSRLSAGGGFASFSLSGSDASKMDLPSIPGFFFGASIDYAFSSIEGLTVEPGAYIFHYGKTFKWTKGLADGEKTYHANYLSVPIHLKYSFPSSSGFGVAAFTGPRFNIGGVGNMFSTGKTYPGLKPIEAQWGVGLAATIQDAVILKVAYDTGLTKCIQDNKDLNYSDIIAHRNTISVGVNFVFQ